MLCFFVSIGVGLNRCPAQKKISQNRCHFNRLESLEWTRCSSQSMDRTGAPTGQRNACGVLESFGCNVTVM